MKAHFGGIRKTIALRESMISDIDRFQSQHSIATETGAIREIIGRGLKAKLIVDILLRRKKFYSGEFDSARIHRGDLIEKLAAAVLCEAPSLPPEAAEERARRIVRNVCRLSDDFDVQTSLLNLDWRLFE